MNRAIYTVICDLRTIDELDGMIRDSTTYIEIVEESKASESLKSYN